MMRHLSSRCFLVVLLTFVLSGCAHKPETTTVPVPPAINQGESQAPAQGSSAEDENAIRVRGKRPLLVQTGLASWYGPPYHNRRSSNGEVYDMNGYTAAHRTLPLGSMLRVTNVKTGHSALVRITDRGPFIKGRMLDLSLAAAKKVDVWAPGVATVRMEVLQTPAPIDRGGRWAVQIGGFEEERAADQLKDDLAQRYQNARVLCFPSPTGNWWLRVRVLADDRVRAEEVARETRTPEGGIFLVRLD